MAAHDPVEWTEYESALGPPAADVVDANPYTAVKTVHDALATEIRRRRTVGPGSS